MEDKIIHYIDFNNGFRFYKYNDITMWYIKYSYRKSLKHFLKLCELKYNNITLVKEDIPIDYLSLSDIESRF